MKFPIKQRMCYAYNERQLRFFKSYTILNCNLECLANSTLEMCGCVGFPMLRFNDTKVSDFNKIECFNYIYHKWTSSYYEDNEERRKNFPDFPCNCLPTCTRAKYILTNEFTNTLENER